MPRPTPDDLRRLAALNAETRAAYRTALMARRWTAFNGQAHPEQWRLERAWHTPCDAANRLEGRLVSRLENYRFTKTPPYVAWDMTRCEARRIIQAALEEMRDE